jgi:hypothetical protein
MHSNTTSLALCCQREIRGCDGHAPLDFSLTFHDYITIPQSSIAETFPDLVFLMLALRSFSALFVVGTDDSRFHTYPFDHPRS